MSDEKVFDKILHAFMIKVIDVIGLQEIHINTIKVKYDNSAVSIIPTWGKFKWIPLKSGLKQGCHDCSSFYI